jgi:hypothetical protein
MPESLVWILRTLFQCSNAWFRSRSASWKFEHLSIRLSYWLIWISLFLVDRLSLFVEMQWMMIRDWSQQSYWRQNWDKRLIENIFSVDRVHVWSIRWVLLSQRWDQYARCCSVTHQLIQLMTQLMIQLMIQSVIQLMRAIIRHYCQHDYHSDSTTSMR